VTLGTEGVHLKLGGEALPLSAKLLIIADGAGSKTAAGLGFETAVKDHLQAAIVANIGLGKAHNGVAYERFTALGPMALLPLSAYRGQPRAALVWTQPSEHAAASMQLSDADFLTALQDQFGYRTGLFSHVGERASYPLTTGLVAEQVRSRIALLGNAAHSLHPVAGQGFNLALRDAASLALTMGRARAVGQDFSSIRVLEEYRLAQSADQQRVLALTRGLPAMFTPRSPGLVAGRNVALMAMNVVAPLRRRFAQLGMGQLQADLYV
jgi:ubiquinone biosynthesis UbiH/UbiF/VisC/COQ6 family hydroxylase